MHQGGVLNSLFVSEIINERSWTVAMPSSFIDILGLNLSQGVYRTEDCDGTLALARSLEHGLICISQSFNQSHFRYKRYHLDQMTLIILDQV